MIAFRKTSANSALQSTVDVWTFALDLPDAAARRLDAFLSTKEQERSRRFAYVRDARRFRAAHGRMREILAFYQVVAPEKIVFGERAHGKPYIAAPDSRLCFNLSHSHGLAVVAVSFGVAIGVDIERINPLDGTGLESALSPREQYALAALAASERRDAFYRCWTRKEALLKAHGSGLRVPLDSFDLPVGREGDDVIVHFGDGPPDCERMSGHARDRIWRLVSFVPAPGFAGAVAIAADESGTHPEPRLRSWAERWEQ